MKYNLNKIDGDLYQIYGEVNGLAVKHHHDGIYAYHFAIKFFIGTKLIKIFTSKTDNTMRNEKDIKERINNILKRESEEQ